MKRFASVLALVLGLASPSTGAADPWLLWSRDTHFQDHQPARLWRRDTWMVRAGPFATRRDCDQRMNQDLHSTAQLLGDGYRVTSVMEVALVARRIDGRPDGLRRRYMCLPGSIAPPK
jgi:hypothetical protein